MLFVAKWQIQNCLLDHFKASIFSHALCAEKEMIAQQIIDYRYDLKQSLLLSPPVHESIHILLNEEKWVKIPVIGMASCTIPISLPEQRRKPSMIS